MMTTSQQLLSPAEQEQYYLNLTGKISLALAGFWLAWLIEELGYFSSGVAHWIFNGVMLVCIIALVAYSSKSWKFNKKQTRRAFWTLKFNDEYTDYISALSIRVTYFVSIAGLIILAIWADSNWFIEATSPLSLHNFVQILLCLSFAAHGGTIVWKLWEGSDDE